MKCVYCIVNFFEHVCTYIFRKKEKNWTAGIWEHLIYIFPKNCSHYSTVNKLSLSRNNIKWFLIHIKLFHWPQYVRTLNGKLFSYMQRYAGDHIYILKIWVYFHSTGSMLLTKNCVSDAFRATALTNLV